MSVRNKQGRDFADLVLGGVRTAQGRNLGVSAHNAMDLERDTERLSQSRGGIATETHQPIPHHRLKGYMNKKVETMARGGDNRTVIPNAVSVMRRIRDNDRITQNRPLG